uniref:MIF4G domain-containing protein n=1 Tax=Salix viminalis TaxID=40686 RepID=A0A6N2KC84_SALVM
MNIETKIRNIRFIGELCKFRIAPASTVFSCLKEIAFQSLMMLQEMVILLIVHKLCGRVTSLEMEREDGLLLWQGVKS